MVLLLLLFYNILLVFSFLLCMITFSILFLFIIFVHHYRYKEGHAVRHWRETHHCYSLELETQRVWDYVGDNYVHRLIQSKTDGKLVELSGDQGEEIDRSCDCDEDLSEALLNSKVEAVIF